MRKEFTVGLLLFSVSMTLNVFCSVPHSLLGFLLGLAVFLEIIGALPENAYQKLKKRKKALLHF